MGEAVFFRNLTTKGLTAVNSGERYFEGYLTVQVKDKQGEVTIVDELMKVLPVWIDRGAPISDTHSNRIIGKGINYSKVEYKDKDGDIYPAIKVTGKIHKNYELDNDIWQKIKSGEYKGLSFGGATKSDREPMRMKDGSIAYSLKDLEHYEVAVCRDPAVPLALITEFNTLAKAVVDGEDLGGGRMLIKCDKYGCYVDKGEKQHQATDVELQQAMGNIKGQTELQNTTRRLGIGRGAARARKPSTEAPYKGYKTATNGEAGIKVQEARENALVYDDKTIDHVNQTPLENQAKVKKGQDWSNADGDRHGMYNQDTDSGGMGKKHTGPKPCKCGDPKCKDPKCKKHKREVGTGHGSEENNTADGWSGSGSPYPKKKKAIITHVHSRLKNLQTRIEISDFLLRKSEGKDEPEYEEDAAEAAASEKKFHETWHKMNPSFKKKPKKKKKAIITNINSRLKSLDFILREKKKKPVIDSWQSGLTDEWNKRHGEPKKKTPPKTPAEETAFTKRHLPGKIEKPKKKKDKKTWTQVVTGHEKPIKPAFTDVEEEAKISEKRRDMEREWAGTKDQFDTSNPTAKKYPEPASDKPNKDTKPESKVEIQDEKSDDQWWKEWEAMAKKRKESKKGKGSLQQDKLDDMISKLKRKRVKKSFFMRVKDGEFNRKKPRTETRDASMGEHKPKSIRMDQDPKGKKGRKRNDRDDGEASTPLVVKVDGEFGGMNTGETEWTEPTDTANSRVKRDKDVA